MIELRRLHDGELWPGATDHGGNRGPDHSHDGSDNPSHESVSHRGLGGAGVVGSLDSRVTRHILISLSDWVASHRRVV